MIIGQVSDLREFLVSFVHQWPVQFAHRNHAAVTTVTVCVCVCVGVWILRHFFELWNSSLSVFSDYKVGIVWDWVWSEGKREVEEETEEVDRLVPGENVRVTGDLPVKVKKGVFGVNETFNN